MISLHGAYENENFGDELLIAIQAKWINDEGYDVCLPFASKVYREQIPSLDKEGSRGLEESEKLIYTGGGYFGEPNHKTFKWGINFFRKKHHIPAKIFKKNNKKYLICGVGAGPITNPITRYTVVKICNFAEKVVVRDTTSYDYLIKYGVIPEKIQVGADVVLSLTIHDLPKGSIEKAKKTLNKDNKNFYLGIHIGVSPDDENYKTNVKAAMESLANVIKRNSVVPVLIADKRNATSTQEKAIEYMSSLLDEEPIVYRHSNIWETCAFLSSLDGVVTTKLHVGITAYTLGTRTFGIAAHQKTRRFYNQIKKENYFYELKEVDNGIESSLELFIKDRYWDEETLQAKKELNERALLCKREMLQFLES